MTKLLESGQKLLPTGGGVYESSEISIAYLIQQTITLAWISVAFCYFRMIFLETLAYQYVYYWSV
jgi:hypothetical protein